MVYSNYELFNGWYVSGSLIARVLQKFNAKVASAVWGLGVLPTVVVQMCLNIWTGNTYQVIDFEKLDQDGIKYNLI